MSTQGPTNEEMKDYLLWVETSQSSGTNEEELDDEAPETEEVEEITRKNPK